MSNTNQYRIYVACLAAYNNGILYGAWIDVIDYDAIWDDINAMLRSSPMPHAEEWAIHGHEGFYNIIIEEYEGVDSVLKTATFVEKYGEVGAEIMSYYGDIDSAERAMEEHYSGEFDSELDFSSELFDDLYGSEVPDHLHSYIDYEAFNRDLFLSDYFSVRLNGKVHVFYYA